MLAIRSTLVAGASFTSKKDNMRFTQLQYGLKRMF